MKQGRFRAETLIAPTLIMDLTESKVHSFIVKLWLEGEGSLIVWHGHVTHVPSGTRRQFRKLSEITDFISEYLEDGDTQANLRTRMKGWFRKHGA